MSSRACGIREARTEIRLESKREFTEYEENNTVKSLPFLIHALSPTHAGVGQEVDVIDLPIARLKATGIPFLPGSGIKGVLRDARENQEQDERRRLTKEHCYAIFGPPTDKAAEHAGALTVGDARLLALPVRSFRGTFAWVTSPLLLTMAQRDCDTVLPLPTRLPTPTPGARNQRGREVPARWALVETVTGADSNLNVWNAGKDPYILLEDLDLPVFESPETGGWARALAPYVAPPDRPDYFTRRWVVVDDETMTFLWETATQVDTRVRLNPETRTVDPGALWTEESLPPETLLLGLLVADRSRRKDMDRPLSPEDVLDMALPRTEILQFGGKATVGRGRCRLIPLRPASHPEQ